MMLLGRARDEWKARVGGRGAALRVAGPGFSILFPTLEEEERRAEARTKALVPASIASTCASDWVAGSLCLANETKQCRILCDGKHCTVDADGLIGIKWEEGKKEGG